MEITKITPADTLWKEVWELYEKSFPGHERRSFQSHVRALADSRFYAEAAVEDGRLQGLLFWWEGEGMVFVEHLGVSPCLRGRGVGRRIMECFLCGHSNRPVILEIDPPTDEISQKRLLFYERLGFRMNAVEYIHPSYGRGGPAHRLSILSYPETLSGEKFRTFSEFIRDTVLAYND